MLAVQRNASYSQKVLASCLNRVVEDGQWLSKMLAYGRSQALCLKPQHWRGRNRQILVVY